MKGRKVEFEWADFIELWRMAYKKGYEDGYIDRAKGNNYRPESYVNPPEVMRKIFVSFEQEEEE